MRSILARGGEGLHCGDSGCDTLWWLISCVGLAGPWSPSRWLNITSDVSVRGFFNEMSTEIGGFWVKQIAFHNLGDPYPISQNPEQNRLTFRTPQAPWNRREFCSRLPLDFIMAFYRHLKSCHLKARGGIRLRCESQKSKTPSDPRV